MVFESRRERKKKNRVKLRFIVAFFVHTGGRLGEAANRNLIDEAKIKEKIQNCAFHWRLPDGESRIVRRALKIARR